MGMRREHDIDCGIERACDVEDRAARISTLVITAPGLTAFVYDSDDCLHALRLQLLRMLVERFRLPDEAHARHTARHDDARSRARDRTDESDPYPVDVFDPCRRHDRLFIVAIEHVGREELEPRAGKLAIDSGTRLPIQKRLRLASAARQTQQVRDATIEFMVSERADVEANRVHHFYRGLVMKQAGCQW